MRVYWGRGNYDCIMEIYLKGFFEVHLNSVTKIYFMNISNVGGGD